MTSWTQRLIALGFAAYIILVAFLFHDRLRESPFDLFGIQKTAQARPSESAH